MSDMNLTQEEAREGDEASRAEPKRPKKVFVPEPAPPKIQRVGKDEMSLVEHPFASLQKEKDTRVIELRWEAQHPLTGKKLEASWRVAGDAEMGLPTANDERLYLVLMEITRLAGWPATVPFSRLDVVRRLGWPPSQNTYRMVHEGFARLRGVSIAAQNAFYNSKNNWFYSGYFGILDEAFVANEGPGRKRKGAEPQSYLRWNNTLHQSFLSGNIRTVDLGFALSLKRPVSLRLFRYLDKKIFGGQKTFQIGVRDLCELHLGMVVDGRYESDLKATLAPAHAELAEHGFLVSASWEPMKTRKGTKVVYRFSRRGGRAGEEQEEEEEASSGMEQAGEVIARRAHPALPLSRSGGGSPDKTAAERKTSAPPPGERAALAARLAAAGVSPSVAEDLCAGCEPDQVRLQLDCLDDRDPKNPAAALVSAIREGWGPPPKYLERLERARREEDARAVAERRRDEKAAEDEKRRQEQDGAERENAMLDALWEDLDEAARRDIDRQAIERLGVLGREGRAPAALAATRRTLLKAAVGAGGKALPRKGGA